MAHEGMHACESHENSVQRALGARAGAPPLPCAVEVCCCSRHEPRAWACPREATKALSSCEHLESIFWPRGRVRDAL